MDIRSVQYPGRAGHPFRTDLPVSMTAWVEDIITELIPFLDRPFILFGHSLGGVLAYELSCSLAERGQSPAALVVSGVVPPHLIPARLRNISHFSDEKLIPHINEYGGTPDALLQHPEFIDYFLPLFRQDIGVLESYRFNQRKPLMIPVLALAGTDDPFAPRGDVEQWKTYTTASFTAITLSGNHFFVENYAAVCVEMRKWLEGEMDNGTAYVSESRQQLY